MTIEQMIARQQQLVDTARAEHRDLNAAETAEYNDLQRQVAQRAASSRDLRHRHRQRIRKRKRAPRRQRGREFSTFRASAVSLTWIRPISLQTDPPRTR